MTTTADPRWQECRVVESVPVAEHARRITLARPSGTGRPAAPGTHIDVRVPLGDGPHAPVATRSYSVVESDDTGRHVTITVALARHSRGGSASMHRLQVGDRISATEPVQGFPLVLGADRFVLLAGGIGVTALVAAARALARVGTDYRMVYVGRSRPAMAYADVLAAEHGERMTFHVDDEGTPLDVQALVDGIAREPGRTELLTCGPVRLMDAVRRAWTRAGLDPTDLRFETFGSGGWFDAEPFEVSVPELGVTTVVEPEQTMLEALVAAGAEMLWDCRKGECGLCVMAVGELEGDIDHRDVFLGDEQKAARQRLCPCVARVVGTQHERGRVVLRTP